MHSKDRGELSKIYKELQKLNNRKTNNPVTKWAKDMNRYFAKNEIQKANSHKKIFSDCLAIREIEIKTTMRFHLNIMRRVCIKK